MDGYQATEMIRKWEQEVSENNPTCTPLHIPIIAITANALRDDQDKCLQVGMDEYVAKPYKIKTISDVIMNLGFTGA